MGFEESIFPANSLEGGSKPVCSKVEICNIPVIYKEVFDGVQAVGQHAYPFEIQLPAWLPPSTMLSNDEDRVNMQTRYEVRTQLVPEDKSEEWANEAERVSKLRGSKSFFVC